MSIFDAGKVCTFSAVKARITLNGVPASGAKVIRLAKLKKENIDTTTTDDNGVFEFPAAFENSLKKFSPAEIVISQQIKVEYQGESYEIWANGKMDARENSELGGVPLDLNCELTDEAKTHRTSASLILTNCKWNEQD